MDLRTILVVALLATAASSFVGASFFFDDSVAADVDESTEPVYWTHPDSPTYTDQGSASNPITDLSKFVDSDGSIHDITLYDVYRVCALNEVYHNDCYNEIYVLTNMSVSIPNYYSVVDGVEYKAVCTNSGYPGGCPEMTCTEDGLFGTVTKERNSSSGILSIISSTSCS